MKAIWNNEVIAESNDIVVVESNHYFPLESVNLNHLVKSSKTTICPWKGTANYYTLKVNGTTTRMLPGIMMTPCLQHQNSKAESHSGAAYNSAKQHNSILVNLDCRPNQCW